MDLWSVERSESKQSWAMLAHMPLIIPEGYAQTILNWEGSSFVNGNAATVLGFGETLGPDPTSLATFAGQVAAATEAEILTSMDTGITLTTVEVIGAVDSATATSGESGARTGEMVPPNCTTLVRKNVSGRGRRRQGRIFWPGLLQVAEVQEGGVITSGRLSALQGIFDAWLGAIETASGVPMVILQNSEGITPPISPPPVVGGLVVDAKIASQRDRLRR